MYLGITFVHWLVLLSALISFTGGIAYIRDTLLGKSKPNRVTWGLWGSVPMIATIAALTAHADAWATVRIFMSGFGPLIIFFISFVNPQSFWKLSKFDALCGAFAIIALVAWALAGSPILAILFSAIADGFATLPTIIKAWKYPETETGFTYVMGFFAAIIIIPSIPVWNIENAAFQIYLLAANALLLLAVYRKRIGL